VVSFGYIVCQGEAECERVRSHSRHVCTPIKSSLQTRLDSTPRERDKVLNDAFRWQFNILPDETISTVDFFKKYLLYLVNNNEV